MNTFSHETGLFNNKREPKDLIRINQPLQSEGPWATGIASNYEKRPLGSELMFNFTSQLHLNSNLKMDEPPANSFEIKQDGWKGLQVQQSTTNNRKTPKQYFESTVSTSMQRVAFKRQELQGPVLMPEIIATSSVTTATKQLGTDQFISFQPFQDADKKNSGFKGIQQQKDLNSKQFGICCFKGAPKNQFELSQLDLARLALGKENKDEQQLFRNFGENSQNNLRKFTIQAQSEFREVAKACTEDFSLPTYTYQSKAEQNNLPCTVAQGNVKLSVMGQHANLNNQMYSESPFEKSDTTNRDSKNLQSNSKTEGQFPFSFGTFSQVTQNGYALGSRINFEASKVENSNIQVVNVHLNQNEENWSALNNARRNANPFEAQQKTRRLTEIQRASTQNKNKFKHSLGSSNARNSNSQKKEQRISNTSTSSCGSITKSNKTIRKNKQKLLAGKVKRQESVSSNGLASSETRQIFVKNNKCKLQQYGQHQGGQILIQGKRSLFDRQASHKAIAGKKFIAQQPQHECGDHDEEPKAENDIDDDQVFGMARSDSLQSSQGLFVGAGLHFNNSQEDEAMIEQNQQWQECSSSDDELIKPKNTNKFQLDPENGGGRIHRLHNVSRIAHLKNGKEGLKSCVIDLFGSRQQKQQDIDESNILESDQKSLPFSRISEEKLEESPPQQLSSLTQQQRTGSSASNTNGFTLKPRNCGAPMHEQYSSGHMRVLNFDANQNSDVRMNTKSSKSSTQRKSLKDVSNLKANRPNHFGIKNTAFEQQHRVMVGDGIFKAPDCEGEKIRNLNKVLDEQEEDEDQINYNTMQADDRPIFLTLQPFDIDKQTVHNVISTKTCADFLKNGGILEGVKRNYIVIDCRFPFEFEGGHIQGAINICDPKDLMPKFFQANATIQKHLFDRTILIFHCELSQQRAPNMVFQMRNLDRHINSERYPQLFYPESYLLEGGYKKFYNEYPELCKDKYVQGTQGGEIFEQMMHCTIKKQKSYNAKGLVLNLKKEQSATILTQQKFLAPCNQLTCHTNSQLNKRQRSESQQIQVPTSKFKLQN